MHTSIIFATLMLIACGDKDDDTGDGGGDHGGGDHGGDGGDGGDDGDGGDTGGEPIEPGTETVSVSWDVDLFTMYENPRIKAFDTLDGQRKLDGMTIEMTHTPLVTIYVENATDIPLSSSDYTHEFYFQAITQLGWVEDGNEHPPFFGPGAFSALQSDALPAADDKPMGGDDFKIEAFAEVLTFEAHYDRIDTAEYLDAMIATDEHDDVGLVVGGFTESFVYWADEAPAHAKIHAGATALQYSGTMTITYEYSAAE